jgi:hypothetical protein
VSEPLDSRAGPLRLHALAGAGLLGPDALARAMTLIERRGTGESWYRFARVQLLLLGAVLAVVGAVFFVAANWDVFPPAAKLAMAATAMAASTLVGGWIGLDRLTGRIAALTGGLLFGPLLALVGQIYQTGADAYELFLAWSVVLVAYALATRFAGAWVTALVLAVTTSYLWIDQGLGSNPVEVPGLWVSLLVAAGATAIALVRPSTGPRDPIFSVAAVFAWMVTFGHGAVAILSDEPHGLARLVPLLWSLVQPALFLWVGVVVRRDLSLIRLGAALLLGLLAAFEGRVIFDFLDLREGGLLVMGLLLIGQGYLGGRWMLHLGRQDHQEGAP